MLGDRSIRSIFAAGLLALLMTPASLLAILAGDEFGRLCYLSLFWSESSHWFTSRTSEMIASN